MTKGRSGRVLLRYAVLVALLVLPWWPRLVDAAELRVPTEGNESGLFTVEVIMTAHDSLSAELHYDVNKLQYAGATPPDPDIQWRRDGLIEISARSGERRYRLKFLMLPQHDHAVLTFRYDSREQRAVVRRGNPAVAGGYHLHLLGSALCLLIVGVILWKYQSRQIDLMSTRSLFYTYEELERRRRKQEDAKTGEESVPGCRSKEKNSESSQVSVATPDRPSEGASHRPLEGQKEQVQHDRRGAFPAAVDAADTPAALSGSVSEHEPRSDIDRVGEKRAVAGHSDTHADRLQPGRETASQTVGDTSRASVPAQTESRPSEFPSVLELLAPLHVVITDEQGRSFSGTGTEVTIGRRKDCRIVVSAAEVSRTHVCIRRRGREYEVVPMATTNITRVNDIVVTQPSKVVSGDTLTLGGAVYRLKIEG